MQSLSVVSPVDGSAISRASCLGDCDSDSLLQRARSAQRTWAQWPLEDRITVCRRFVVEIGRLAESIAADLVMSIGRPSRFAPKEIVRVAERAGYMLDIAECALASIAPTGRSDSTRRIDRVPHGVCLVVAPWNYPYLTAINSVIPALVAGNAVVLKPATQTASSGEYLADAFEAAGLPEGVFSSACLSHATIHRWIAGRSIDFVSFTGSVRGGTEIERAAAGRFLPLALELGGKDPAYVRSDADLDAAVPELVDGAFFNSGQSCCSVERIYVDKTIYGPFIDRFVATTLATQLLGDPREAGITLGPVVSDTAAGNIRRQIEQAVTRGARVLTGLDGVDGGGDRYIPATTLVDVTHGMDVMTEETFGPVVGIMPVENDAHALTLMNDSRYGLSASVWTRDRAAAERIGQGLATGTVMLNRCDYLDPALAWVGIKDSGRGCSLSEIGYHQVTRPKSFLLG